MKKFGVDISRWQGDFDFKKAIAEGVEFVIIKGGGGDDGLYVDSQFLHNYKSAKANNLSTGSYWFSKAISEEEAEKEAEYFYTNVIKDKQFELPIYVDVEHRQMLDLGKDKLTKVVKAFCKKLEALGCWVGIYSSLNYFNSYMNDKDLQQYAHWVAQWSDECTYKGNSGVLGMWQFGGETNLIRTNKVAGVTCDQNYMLIDYPSLIKQAGLNGFNKNIEENIPKENKTVEEIANEVIQGKWGNGVDRKNRLTAAGYNYDAIQAKVDELMKTDFLSIGDVIRITSDSVVYGTLQKFDNWVYKTDLYVRGINGSKITISRLKEGAITGVVDRKYIKKV